MTHHNATYAERRNDLERRRELVRTDVYARRFADLVRDGKSVGRCGAAVEVDAWAAARGCHVMRSINSIMREIATEAAEMGHEEREQTARFKAAKDAQICDECGYPRSDWRHGNIASASQHPFREPCDCGHGHCPRCE